MVLQKLGLHSVHTTALINVLKTRDTHLTQDQLEAGLRSLISTLADAFDCTLN